MAAACTRPLRVQTHRPSSRTARLAASRPVVAAASADGGRRAAIQEPRELDGLDSALAGLSTPAMNGAAAALLAVGLGTGAALAGVVARACPPAVPAAPACGPGGEPGSRSRAAVASSRRDAAPSPLTSPLSSLRNPLSTANNNVARAAGAALTGAAAAAGAVALVKRRAGVAPKELYNSLAGDAQPLHQLPEQVRRLRERGLRLSSLGGSELASHPCARAD